MLLGKLKIRVKLDVFLIAFAKNDKLRVGINDFLDDLRDQIESF